MENPLIGPIKKQALKNPDNIALIWRDQTLTYQELVSKIEETSKKLSTIGIKPYDRIGVLLENTPNDLILALAIINSYAVLVPLPNNYTHSEIERHLLTCATNTLVDKKIFKLIKLDLYIDSHKLPDILTRGTQNIYNMPAIIRPTSGTTGKQKGVILTYQSIISRIDYANKLLNITKDDNIFWCLSISFHLAVSIILFLQKGATIDFQELNKLTISDHKIYKPISLIYATPWHYQLLVNHNDLVDKHSFNYLRLALSTAITLPNKIANNFYKRFAHPLRQAYGIIEAGLVSINYKTPPDDLASVGRICPGFEIKIKDIHSKDNLQENQLGEIYIKSKALFAGYVNNSSNFLENGWFATGDIGFIKNNILYLKGRTKSVINIGGLKLFPEEVESVLEEHDCIKHAWIYTKYDSRFGQIIKAKLVINNDNIDRTDSSYLKQGITKFLNTKLTSYKIPLDFEFVETIPLTKTGKKLRCPLPFPAEIVIPHRSPMLLIDQLLERDREKESALLQAIVPSSGPFVHNNRPIDEYFIELCAQAMAVVNGYDAWLDNKKSTKGFLVGIEHFNFNLPSSFNRNGILYIEIKKKFKFANITVMLCKIYYNKKEIVNGHLKVWSLTEE